MKLRIEILGTGFGCIYPGRELVAKGRSNGGQRPFNPEASERRSRVIDSRRDCCPGDVNIFANIRRRCVPDCPTSPIGAGGLVNVTETSAVTISGSQTVICMHVGPPEGKGSFYSSSSSTQTVCTGTTDSVQSFSKLQ